MLSQLIMTVKALVVLFTAIYGFAWMLRSQDAAWVKGAPRLILPCMFMLGMWGHIVWLPFLALLILIPLLAKSRADAAALYAVAILSIPALGYKVVFGSFYLMPMTKWLFCALGLIIAFFLKDRIRDRGLTGARFDIPFYLLFILEATQARDPNYTDTLRQLTPIVLTLVLPYFVLSRSLTKAEDVHRFLLALAFGGFVMASIAIVESRFHWLMYKTIESNLNITSPINAYGKMRGGMIRAPASFPESTALGNYLALSWVALLALRNSFASTGKWYLALGVMMIGLLAANSRGGFVGVAIGTLAFDLYCRRYAAMFSKLGLIGGAYVIILGLAQFSAYFASVAGKDAGTESSSDYRVLLLRRGMEEIRKHPYLGTNMKQALNNLEDIRQGEHIIDLVNGYISYGLTLGYAGIIGLVMIFVSLGLAMAAARRKISVSSELVQAGGFVFAVAALTAASSFYTGFGGDNSTPFVEVAALGSAIWAIRRYGAPGGSLTAAARHPAAMPAIRQVIEADRAAKARPVSTSASATEPV